MSCKLLANEGKWGAITIQLKYVLDIKEKLDISQVK